jgi:hypothetical protein
MCTLDEPEAPQGGRIITETQPEQIMKKRTKRVMGIVAITAGALGAAGALFMRMKEPRRTRSESGDDVWARPGMAVTFRAELKPGRDAAERTFRVAELLTNGRVTVEGIAGEHAENEFERIR